MENLFKLKLSRLFRSCKTKNLTTDVIIIDDITPHHHFHENIIMHPPHQNYHLFELFSPKPRTLSSCFRPKFPLHTFSDGHKCPPTSPILPPYHHRGNSVKPQKNNHNNKKKKKKKTRRYRIRRQDFDDFPDFEYKGLFSSSDDDADDDEPDNRHIKWDGENNNNNGDDDRCSSEMFSSSNMSSSEYSSSMEAAAEGVVKDSFAVVKRSRDPYGDFKASMMEMILEKHMFGAKDLEKLLECFLSLNSDHHHRIIVDVFTEICETLFC